VYLGSEALESQASQASYQAAPTSAERKYGWELVECRTALPYICEVAPDRCALRCAAPALGGGGEAGSHRAHARTGAAHA
jgi:hypothetical protein